MTLFDDFLREIGDDSDSLILSDAEDLTEEFDDDDDDEEGSSIPFFSVAELAEQRRKSGKVPLPRWKAEAPILKKDGIVLAPVRFWIEGTTSMPKPEGVSTFEFKKESLINMLPLDARRSSFTLIGAIHQVSERMNMANMKIHELARAEIMRCEDKKQGFDSIVKILMDNFSNEEVVILDGKREIVKKSIRENPFLWNMCNLARYNALIKIAMSPNEAMLLL